MLRLLRQEDVAILLMSELAHYPDRSISLAEIGKNHGVSMLFLKKLARHLRGAGLIESKEGAYGGYKLARDARAISVWDVMQAVGGEQKIEHSRNTQEQCPLYAGCLPQTIRKTLSDALRGSLSTIFLCDLIRQQQKL